MIYFTLCEQYDNQILAPYFELMFSRNGVMQIHYPLVSIRFKSLWFLTTGKVKRIYQLKVLGIFIRSDLDWHCHSNYIDQKINKSVFLIAKLNSIVSYEFYFPLTILVGMYTLISHMGQFCGPTVLIQKVLFTSQKQGIRALFKVHVGCDSKQLIVNSKIISLPCIQR